MYVCIVIDNLFPFNTQDVNMMPESEDKKITEGTINGAVTESSQSAEETQNAHEKVDDNLKSELRAPPAWLQMETNQGSSKVKLPPVTEAHVNKKRKRHSRNSRQNSRVKMNSTIEPVPEELPNLNVNTWNVFPLISYNTRGNHWLRIRVPHLQKS